MAVVHATHHRRTPGSAMMAGMDMVGNGAAKRSGKVLVLPPAPDAIELRHLRAFVAVAEELNSVGRRSLCLADARSPFSASPAVRCDLLRRHAPGRLTWRGRDARPARRCCRPCDAVHATRSRRRPGRRWPRYEPINDLTAASPDLQALRDAGEPLHGPFELAPGMSVRPVIAGGVPSLLVTPRPAERPTVLLLHGGGFVMGSAFGYRHLASAVAAAADTGVIVPDFRLAPEHP